MDFTMENLRIMDTGEPMMVDQSALVGSDEEGSDFKMRTEKMDWIVLHSEVPAARTCVKGMNPSPDNLG
eukprot:5310612-Heterocapsa_arctica.AAC.1